MAGKFSSELEEIERMVGALIDSIYAHFVDRRGHDRGLYVAVGHATKALLDVKLTIALARHYADIIDNTSC